MRLEMYLDYIEIAANAVLMFVVSRGHRQIQFSYEVIFATSVNGVPPGQYIMTWHTGQQTTIYGNM